MKVVFCLPGNEFSDIFVQSWVAFQSWLHTQDIKFVAMFASGSNVSKVRDRCLRPFKEGSTRSRIPFHGEIDYDYIMWIDSDIGFRSEHFKKLLDWNVDIVSGVYRMANTEAFACEIDKSIPYIEGKLIESIWNGIGFTLIKKGVFEKIEPPWFQTTTIELNGVKEMYVTEDIFFCAKAKAAGFITWIDPEVVLAHKKFIVI